MKTWQPGMPVQIGATYREKATGVLMEIKAVDGPKNYLCLSPPVKEWKGTSQEFAKAFEFVRQYRADARKPALIEASQDLLAALKAICGANGVAWEPRTIELFDNAKAAIAKAEETL